MSRFFFDIRHEITVPDTEGSEHENLAAAIAEAHEAARELLAEGVKRRQDRRSWVIEIRDEAGTIMATAPLDDVWLA